MRMTRDEAAKTIRNINYPDDADNHSAWSERMIDTFVALGMLKLDEPKDEKYRFFEAIENFVTDRAVQHHIWHALDLARLKIIEK